MASKAAPRFPVYVCVCLFEESDWGGEVDVSTDIGVLVTFYVFLPIYIFQQAGWIILRAESSSTLRMLCPTCLYVETIQLKRNGSWCDGHSFLVCFAVRAGRKWNVLVLPSSRGKILTGSPWLSAMFFLLVLKEEVEHHYPYLSLAQSWI